MPNKTITDLKKSIAAFTRRSQSSFVENGADNLLRAINNAKDFAQRAINFEFALQQAQVLVADVANGGSLEDAVFFGTTNPIQVKEVRNVFLQMSDASGQFPIGIMSRQQFLAEQRRIYESVRSVDARQGGADITQTLASFPLTFVRMGMNFFVYPNSSAALGTTTNLTVYMDVIEWLQDYNEDVTGTATSTVPGALVDATATFITDGVVPGQIVYNTTTGTAGVILAVVSETTLDLSASFFTSGHAYRVGTSNNFLLDYGYDFMLFRSIFELNFLLKEEQRFQVSDKILSSTWRNLVAWNDTFIENRTEDTTLD